MTNQTNPDLAWMIEAKRHAGLYEIVGPKHNKIITDWVIDLGGWWRDDETPWCGVFIAHCLKTAGFKKGATNSRSKTYKKGNKDKPGFYPFNWYGAGEYRIEGGVELEKPCYGCVAVKSRKGGNHVTFIVGKTNDGLLVGLGGNQSNSVCYAKYKSSEFDTFMWYGKTDKPSPHRFELPVIKVLTSTKVSES